jgi:hypothetical protein
MAHSPRKKQNLQTLLREWDDILAATGFKDAERTVDGERHLVRFSSHIYRKDHFHSPESKMAYYDAILDRINAGALRNEVDQIIMNLHASGCRKNQIVEQLSHKGHNIHRKTVMFIIRRYESSWGLRAWSNRQLNLKKKPDTE